jgi:hypothetical protein
MPLYDELQPSGPITDPDSERTLGLSEFPARAMGQAGPANVEEGSMLYSGGELSWAQALCLAPCDNYFREQAPWKVAEEWQAADISYAVEYADQDYRRMNESQAKANTWRTKAPKADKRPSTSEIISNLSGSPANSLLSDDNSILALLGY